MCWASSADSNKVHRLGSMNDRLQAAFLRWQCRIRQISARTDAGQPSPGMMPIVLRNQEAIGQLTTVLCKRPEYSVTMELRHIARRTLDPAKRRDDVLEFVSERYYQGIDEFSPELTAVCAADSAWIDKLTGVDASILRYEQFNQRFDIACRAHVLCENNPLREATFWHNLLFNPSLPADCVVLGFEPDWSQSSVTPAL